jgi:FlaA1/EpsC-like NDP-sugar epimerase
MQHATGGEIFVRKAPACTIRKLAEAVCQKFSPQGADHPVNITGIRPGEKLHETLVNEYEMQRVIEEELFFAIHPEYHMPEHRTEQPLGTEYTSTNTHQLNSTADIGPLLDQMGEVELYI